ncbi:MAG TPA: PEGA domain-containing protein [Polyangiaceae bacterium]|nr:PEGA domain-containing protein [Polyangiaceae bacterium]
MTPVAPRVSTAVAEIDHERALELDALATAILKQHFAPPQTLVGLGVPEPKHPKAPSETGFAQVAPDAAPSFARSDEPPETVRAKPQVLNAALIEAALADADDDDETVVMPDRAARSLVLGEAQQHAHQLLDAVDADPIPNPVFSATTPPVEELRQPLQTITPPPPSEASDLEPSSLPNTRRYDMTPHLPQKHEAPSESARPRGTHSDAPWAVPPSRPRKAPHVGTRLALMVAAFGASLAATFVLINALSPSRKGNLLVTAAGPNQIRVDRAEVLLDGKPVCSQVPCRLEGISSGAHAVTVRAPDYENMAAQPIIVRGGGDSALQLTLTRRDTAVLKVNTKVSGLSLRLDGEERGSAPTTLPRLAPGEHIVRLSGNSAYAPFEQRVVLEADRTLTIEPQLTPLHTVVRVEAGTGADDARVELVNGNERVPLTKLPARVELAPGNVYRVHATKRAFRDFDEEVRFDANVPERSLTVTLLPRDAKAPPEDRRASSSSTAASVPTTGGSGTLSINSIPISSVLLDGRPVGSTPQKLTLDSGSHSVVFVHPTLGRKERNVSVNPGKTAVAAVRF